MTSDTNEQAIQAITVPSSSTTQGLPTNFLDTDTSTSHDLERQSQVLALVDSENWSPTIVFENEVRLIGRCIARENTIGQLAGAINFEFAAWMILNLLEVCSAYFSRLQTSD